MKNTLLGFIVASVLVAVPLAATAESTDLQSQINALLEQIKVLQAKLADLVKQQPVPPKPIVVDPVMPEKHRVCFLLSRNLLPGSAGDDVGGLQEFLSEQGLFNADVTGYFGPVTAQALATWQVSQGVEAAGVVGPMTRERIKIWCGGGVTPADWKLRAEPQKGTAPLTVTFAANVTLMDPAMVADAGDYMIQFGDGGEHRFVCSSKNNGSCRGPHKTSHTYSANGTYIAKLIHYGYFPAPNVAPTRTVGEVTIRVADQEPVACTMEYNPVCGAKPIVCITTPCNPIPTTYGNKCAMNADGAKFLYAGECRTDKNPGDDPKCKSWYDGCNTCSRSTPGSPAMCTLRACTSEPIATRKCTVYFDDTTPTNKPPTISSFSGPTTLRVNQTGTWIVQANDPENQQLTYKISWGDDKAYAGGTSMAAHLVDSFVQTTTFTHVYATAGEYTVKILVRDSAGGEAVATATVGVPADSVVCTMEYAPVCGQPPEPSCRYTYPFCMMPTPGPTTYSNKCLMRAAGATFISEGVCGTTPPVACTADAKLCPNGTYVGRTGPNCEFVCPTTPTICPQYQMPLCPNGTVVVGPASANGCPGAPICKTSDSWFGM